MKKLVKFTKNVKEEKEIEIEFPIYRKRPKDEHSSVDWYYKVTEDLVEYGIHFYRSEQNIEISIDKDVEFTSDEDYEFGLGKYACTKEEFEEVWNEALKELNEV